MSCYRDARDSTRKGPRLLHCLPNLEAVSGGYKYVAFLYENHKTFEVVVNLPDDGAVSFRIPRSLLADWVNRTDGW